MGRPLIVLLAGFLILPFSQALQCRSPSPETPSRYRIIEIKKRKDLQPELEKAAASGDRFVWGSSYFGMLITEPQPDVAHRREYLVKGYVDEAEFKTAGEAGFRLIRFNRNAEQLFLEKPADAPGKIEYVVLKTNRTLTLEREMQETVNQGFRVAWVGFGKRYMAILDRAPAGPQGASREAGTGTQVKLLAAERFSTIEKELAEQGAQGYRVLSGFLAGEAILIL